jgi:hypothetical protein
MAKKKEIGSNQLPVVSEEQERPRNDMYTVGTWRGIPQYVCAVCKFDTLDEMVMLRHLVNKHNSEAALERLVELEKDKPKPPAPSVLWTSPPNRESADLGEKSAEDVFEVELVEAGSTVDAQGNEHKNFVIKE